MDCRICMDMEVRFIPTFLGALGLIVGWFWCRVGESQVSGIKAKV